MEEYSLSFLVKDRRLDAKKRAWIRDNVCLRECVHFVTPEEATHRFSQPYVPDPHAATGNAPGTVRKPEETERRDLCRCGRQYNVHLDLSVERDRSRDYRLFSEKFATDVFFEIINTQFSKYRPVSYAPKQVIRLAADTELDTLRQLISQVWCVPKSRFLVSLHGSCEGVDDDQNLSRILRELLQMLSNPGSAVVTVSQNDPAVYRQALEACHVTWPQLPYAEVTPVAFLSWSSLTDEEKRFLVEETRKEKPVSEFIEQHISALSSRGKGYFLLTDYGVHADPHATTAEEREQPHDRMMATVSKEDGYDQSPTSPQTADVEQKNISSTDTVHADDRRGAQAVSEVERTYTVSADNRQSTQALSVTEGEREDNTSENSLRLETDPLLPKSSESDQPLSRTSDRKSETNQRSEKEGGVSTQEGSEERQMSNQENKEDRGLSTPSSAKMPDDLQSSDGSRTDVTHQQLNRPEKTEQSGIDNQPSVITEEDTKDSADHQQKPTEQTQSIPAGPSVKLPRTPADSSHLHYVSGRGSGGISEHARKQNFFNYTFPHPLRGRVETVLQGHTRDPDGQRTLMILYGCTSFPDLAAAHGAVRSGVPVIVDQHGTGATAFLLAVMKQTEDDVDSGPAMLASEERNNVAQDGTVKMYIESHKSKLKDYKRYKGQIFRVIRDILAHPDLVTVCDLHVSPIEGAVEAFIKARTEEEALTFVKKNTMRLAAEDGDHPVKIAQRLFQSATIANALKLNRPELLDVVVDQGFVEDFDVFRRVDRLPFSFESAKKSPAGTSPPSQDRSRGQRQKKTPEVVTVIGARGTEETSATDKEAMVPKDWIPFSQIIDLRCFEAREYFVQHVCGLEKISSEGDSAPSGILHQMFLFAVLNGKTPMAKYFWKRAVFQDHVAHALVAAHVSSYLAEHLPGDHQVRVFKEQAEEFENLAKGTLNDCYLQDPQKASAIVTKKAAAFGLSPIEAAVSFHMRSFIALPASSDFLDSVWKGEDQKKSSKFKDKDCCRPKCALVKFFTTPRTICFVSTLFYMLFLGLYGHTIIFQSGQGRLSPLDISLIVWTLAFFVEEVIQFLKPNGFLKTRVNSDSTLKGKLSIYISDPWNILDALSLFFFLLGYILRGALPASEAGHVILSLDYVLFFLRLLRVLTFSRSIGPMLPMIWNMLGDLVPFLIILFVFVFAYGVASEALLHPGTSWHGLYLLYLPRVAFWPIFGEYGLDTIDGADCQNNSLWYAELGGDVVCPSKVGRHVVPVLLGIYILITNVLMLNLLIAYFNHSFEKVHNESNIWWAWLRCGLISEYYARPAVPAPFILLYRVAKAIWWPLGKLSTPLRSCLSRCWRCCCACCSRRKESRLSSDDLPPSFELSGLGVVHFVAEQRVAALDDIHAVFSEEANVLDILDLEEFRFSDLGREPDHEKATFVEAAAPPGRKDELKKWEAAKASCHLLSQSPQTKELSDVKGRSKDTKKQSMQGELEDMLLRLERKLEDNKEQLRSLSTMLTKSVQESPHGQDAAATTDTQGGAQ